MSVGTSAESAGITVGKVVAGAAMVAGAVLLAVAAFPELLNAKTPEIGSTGVFDKISAAIKDLFFKADGKTLSGVGKAMVGAGALGGGYTLYNAMGNKEESMNDARAEQDLFRAREDIRRINSQMNASLMGADPAYFAQAPMRG